MNVNTKIESTTEYVGNAGGLELAGLVARAFGLATIPSITRPWRDALLSMFGLLVMGRSSFEEIALFRNDPLFRSSLGLKQVPAKATIRIYLGLIVRVVGDTILKAIREANTFLLSNVKITPVTTPSQSYIPVDVDVSTMDNSKSHKEGVSRTYMGTDGYAPIFSYIGADGYMLDSELRPGSQHSQKGTPEFLKRNLAQIECLKLKHPILFRLDGGNDAIDTIRALNGNGCFFLIKRNLRKDNIDYWLDIATSLGKAMHPREGKTVYTGTITKAHPKAEPGMPELDVVFEVTVRTIDRNGNQFMLPDIEVETWWTNLYEEPETVIALYHDHGTSEQYHSELKSDMGVERLPSGKMKVNALILTLAMFAFNTLRFIGQHALALPGLLPMVLETRRKRIRKVIDDLILIGCKLVWHSRQFTLRIWENNPWLPVFKALHSAFQAL